MPKLLDTPEQVLAFPLTGVRLIEASAGTGKTYTIANLYLRQILAGIEVGQLLVVTFTKPATEELRGRIRLRLVEALTMLEAPPGAPPPRDAFLAALGTALFPQGEPALAQARQRLRLAVRSMDEASIFTIHGFCQRALTEFAFLSGQQFGLEILTDTQDLWRAALQDWWRRTGYPLDLGRARLLRDTLGGLDGLLALVTPLLGPQPRRLLPEVQDLAAVLARVDTVGPVIARLALVWAGEDQRLSELLARSPGLKRAQGTPYHPDCLALSLAQVDAWFAGWVETQEFTPPPRGFEVLTPQSLTKHAKKKADPNLAEPYFDACGDLWDQLQTLQRDLRIAALLDAAAFARDQVELAKERAQALGYDDLLTRLYAALDPAGDIAGDTAQALAEALRKRFPAAMIDEFQDTDAIQYGIFRRLYLGREDAGLVMIGDPKQAIYGFRGGDIFAYGRARADVGPAGLYSLGTNWRSTPGVIAAVNSLFGRRGTGAFVFADAIPFTPASPAECPHQPMYRDDAQQPALTLWTLPQEHNGKGEERPLSKEKTRGLAEAAVAAEVAALIAAGRNGRARLAAGPEPHPEDRPLRPQDIAILVRTRFAGAALRRALAAWGVRAVSVETTPVFSSPEAAALEPLLEAVAEPGERDLARTAIASPLLGLGYDRIEAEIQGETAWAAWLDTLLALRQAWQQRGFMAMFQGLLQYLGTHAEAPLDERRLTNLLHLGELLQQASKAQAGVDGLLAWYRARRAEADGSGADEHQMRLESDADLVQIVTIHGAKGLEYPVVFLPDLWGCKTREDEALLAFHEGSEALLDAGSEEREAHLRLAERERLAEDLRAVYVALTRAKAALYLVWGRAGSDTGRASQSALGWLLHPHQAEGDLLSGAPDAFANIAALQPDLDALAAQAGGQVQVLPIPEPAAISPLAPLGPPPDLRARRPTRAVPRDWHITSFSELARNVHPGPTPPRDPAATDPALRFPAGSEAGSYLHALLERIDFRADVGRQVLDLSARISPRFGMDHQHWGADAAAWLELVVKTPLDAQGLSLSRIAPMQRLSELEFDFAAAGVDIAALNLALQELWPEPQAGLDAEGFSGLVTGVIDLVFEHGGRYYIADYKSNFLGPNPEDYAQDRLAAAVLAHRYDLQYLLYTLALHRYLGARLPGYAYERHFGGACYLFLRGMRPETGHRLGVFWARTDLALVERLDRQVFRRPETA